MSRSFMQVSAPKANPSLWANKNFVYLFLTGVLITLGSKIYELALPLLIYQFTKSSTAMGAMSGIELLPNLLLAAFIGVLVDRFHKRKFMLLAVFMQFILMVGLYMLASQANPPLWSLYILAFFLSLFAYCYYNSRFVVIKHTIAEEHFTQATANFTSITMFIMIIGPALSGFLLMMSNLQQGLLLTAITLFISCILSCFIQFDEEKPTVSNSFIQELKEGWQVFRNIESLWIMTWIVVFSNAFYGIFFGVVVFFGKDTLHLSTSQIGIAFAFSGAGGLIGSYIAKYIKKFLPLGKYVGLSILLSGISYISMYWADSLTLMSLSLFLVGIFSAILAIGIHVHRQELTPKHAIGRVVGITGSLFKIGLPFTLFGSGWLASVIPSQYIFLLAGVLSILLFVIYRFLPCWNIES